MKRLMPIVAVVLAVAFIAMIAETAVSPQHPCEKCGAEMQPFEFGSSIYKCQCGAMVDEGFQR